MGLSSVKIDGDGRARRSFYKMLAFFLGKFGTNQNSHMLFYPKTFF